MVIEALASILKGNGNEMIASDGIAYISHQCSFLKVEETPSHIKSIISSYISKHPQMRAAYISMVGQDEDEIIKQCIKCRFASLDNVADIDKNGDIVDNEYVQCDKRGGECKFEGIGCNKSIIYNGNKISNSELRYISLCHLEEKEIADKLFISPYTASTHAQNLRCKTGAPTGKKLVAVAAKLGILN